MGHRTTTPTTHPTYLTVRGIANKFEVEIDTVRKWRVRDPSFPEPDHGTCWDEAAVEQWGLDTERLELA